MKRNLTFLLGLFLTVSLQFTAVQTSIAQTPGTDGDGFVLEIVSPSSIAQLLQNTFNECGWVEATFGGEITEELCGEVVWATPDSLGCTALTPGSLTDKIALIRRGSCDFSAKVFNAQKAGAKAVIVANHYTGQFDQACATYVDAATFFGGMSGGVNADSVTIPAVFIQRQTAEQISGVLDAGGTVEVCFGFPTMFSPTAAYHYATPVSQVDTLDHIGVVFVNREPTTIYNVGLRAVVEEPDGNMVTIDRTLDSAESGVDNLIYFFPAYVPAAIPGKFKVTYSNDVYSSARDSVVAYFEHTEYTYAVDNLDIVPGGAAADAATFAAANFFTQYGAMCLTNESGAVATYATFGLANAAAIHSTTGTQGENDLFVYLYDADVDNDGVWEFAPGAASFDDLAAGLVGLTVYEIKGTEGVDSLFSVPIADLNDPFKFSVTLKPNHPYYVSVSYDGVISGLGVMPAYSFTNKIEYVDPLFFTTPLFIDQMYSGWANVSQILRLQLEGFDPGNTINTTVAKLDVNIEMLPNPAVDVLRVNLDFGKPTNTAVVSLMNGLGQVQQSERLTNLESGQVRFNVGNLASGTYLLSVRTPEGVAVEKVMICH